MCACGQSRARTAQNYQVPANLNILSKTDNTVQALLLQSQQNQANQIDLQAQMIALANRSKNKVYR